jgi:hypothetical protein
MLVQEKWSDELLNMGTEELRVYLQRHPMTDALVTDLKLERRKMKNRAYVKDARLRHKEERSDSSDTVWESMSAEAIKEEVSSINAQISALKAKAERLSICFLQPISKCPVEPLPPAIERGEASLSCVYDVCVC